MFPSRITKIIYSLAGIIIIALIKIFWKKLPFYRIKELEERVARIEKSDPDKKWQETKSKLNYAPNIYYEQNPNGHDHYYCAFCSDRERNPITIYDTGKYLYCKKCSLSAQYPPKR